MKSVGLGVIGCGHTGRGHVEAGQATSLTHVVAVADIRHEAAREVAREFGVGTAYADAHSLLKDPAVEAVVLAMPTFGRTPLALEAFRLGKHVLLEKPVAMNADEVSQMIEARGELVAGCCSSRYRFQKSADTAAELVASGALGELRVLRCRAIRAAKARPKTPRPAWRLRKSLNGGGVLMNWGCYDLDYLLGITGWSLRPKYVLAQTWLVPEPFQSHVAPGSDAETHCAAIIRCENGSVITFERGEYVAAQTEEAWEILGSTGSLRLQMTPSKGERLVYDSSDSDTGAISRVVSQGEDDRDVLSSGALQDYAAAIRERRQPRTGLEQALIVQKTSDAIYASAEQGVPVEIHWPGNSLASASGPGDAWQGRTRTPAQVS